MFGFNQHDLDFFPWAKLAPFGCSTERFSAGAAILRVRIFEGEARSLQGDHEVDRRAREVFVALVVDEDAHAVALDHGVIGIDLVDETQHVFVTGAAARLDHDAEAVDRLVGPGDRVAYRIQRTIGQIDHCSPSLLGPFEQRFGKTYATPQIVDNNANFGIPLSPLRRVSGFRQGGFAPPARSGGNRGAEIDTAEYRAALEHLQGWGHLPVVAIFGNELRQPFDVATRRCRKGSDQSIQKPAIDRQSELPGHDGPYLPARRVIRRNKFDQRDAARDDRLIDIVDAVGGQEKQTIEIFQDPQEDADHGVHRDIVVTALDIDVGLVDQHDRAPTLRAQ